MQTSKDSQNQTPQVDTEHKVDTEHQIDTKLDKSQESLSKTSLTIDNLIDAQVDFMQQWLRSQAQPLSLEAWQWFGAQPLNKYLSRDHLQHLINDWLLNQPMSEAMRTDIRDILHTVIYHPVNDNVPLSELIDDTQVETLASYIGSHDAIYWQGY